MRLCIRKDDQLWIKNYADEDNRYMCMKSSEPISDIYDKPIWCLIKEKSI